MRVDARRRRFARQTLAPDCKRATTTTTTPADRDMIFCHRRLLLQAALPAPSGGTQPYDTHAQALGRVIECDNKASAKKRLPGRLLSGGCRLAAVLPPPPPPQQV